MQQDPNPSAPPEDSFEWVPEGMSNDKKDSAYPVLNGIENDNDNQAPSDFIIPNDMAIPDAIQQQIIYQRIMAEQQQQQEDKPQKPIEQKVEPQPTKLTIPQAQPSFLSPDIDYPESELFKTAGLCVWRPKANGKGIQIMMGLEKQSNALSFFGGKRDASDTDCVATAVREFHEETGKQLDNETLSQIGRMLVHDENRMCFWKVEWKSVLFYYEMAYDYEIVKQYKHGWNAEIKRLFWIDFDKIYHSVFIHANPIKVSKNKYPLRSFVVGMMLHDENKKYLMNLHFKNGGDMNHIQPKKGGDIRSTLQSSFTHIPKVIRLDVLHPITHNTIYHRWIEMDMLQIEDYQLLVSLISSICPEIGRNFRLYYTDDKCFKTSKTQYVIDTIPSFNALLQRLKKKKSHYVTQLALLPTFIVSDNFKGIPLSFKPRDVSWKHIHPEDDDDQKNTMSAFVYNKANDLAQWWFGDDDDDDDSNNNKKNEMIWKWQFMNDKNHFEDLDTANSRHIEQCFVSGHSFAGFKRQSANYQANFINMCQKNLKSNKIRVIRRVPSSVKGDIPSQNNNSIKYCKWQYQDDNGQWMDYDRSISQQLNILKQNNAIGFGPHHPFDMRYTLSTNIPNANQYLIDVWHNKQRNVKTKKERTIQQIAVHNEWLNHSSYQWQFKDKKWKNYEDSISHYIEKEYNSNPNAAPFVVTVTSKQTYKIYFNSMQQQSLSSGKFRTIRRRQMGANNIKLTAAKHAWEWQDDDGSYKAYDKKTSQQIESAANANIKKYFFVSTKNNNSYEVDFCAMTQYNVQSGKQRQVRKILLEPEWAGPGPNPKQFLGPKGADRRTFGEKVCDLYCVVGDNVAREVRKSGKLIRATLGPFGAGLYFYDSAAIAQQMAKDRSVCNKGNVICGKVFVGQTHDVSNCDDKEYDFIGMQKNAKDSVSRSLGFGTQYIVYNTDQVCIVKLNKYRR
eukprot:22007_1